MCWYFKPKILVSHQLPKQPKTESSRFLLAKGRPIVVLTSRPPMNELKTWINREFVARICHLQILASTKCRFPRMKSISWFIATYRNQVFAIQLLFLDKNHIFLNQILTALLYLLGKKQFVFILFYLSQFHYLMYFSKEMLSSILRMKFTQNYSRHDLQHF